MSSKISEARHVLVDRDMEHSMLDSTNMTGMTIAFYDQTFVESLPDKGPIPRDRNADFTQESTSVLIYTSGTTGLPKAVGGKAGREYSGARSMAKYLKLKRSDKFYTCLPLYHAAAQGLCMSPVIYAGGSVRLARRFSHKTFWSDVVESKATRLQYVGEICRYLVNAPLHPLERSHVIEEAWGNGETRVFASYVHADHFQVCDRMCGKYSGKDSAFQSFMSFMQVQMP